MTPGSTSTGAVLEAMILPALAKGGYVSESQVVVGKRIGGGTHKVDAVAQIQERKILVSVKWQQTSGTAEQKVPFEVICLAEAVLAGAADKAYLVLGGEGWTLREYYVGGGLTQHLAHAARVEIMTLEGFVARANRGEL